MSEQWVATKAGAHLAGRKKVDTLPEILLRRAVHAEGARFRLHRRLAPACTPDVVLPGRRVAVFVDGDYWHGCPQHGRQTPFLGPNAALWEAKMLRNQQRDRDATKKAEALGWRVVRPWECQIKADPVQCAKAVLGVATAFRYPVSPS